MEQGNNAPSAGANPPSRVEGIFAADSVAPANPSFRLDMQAAAQAVAQPTGTTLPVAPAPAPIVVSGQNPIAAAPVTNLASQLTASTNQTQQTLAQLQRQTQNTMFNGAQNNMALLQMLQQNTQQQRAAAQQPQQQTAFSGMPYMPFSMAPMAMPNMMAANRPAGEQPPAKRQAMSPQQPAPQPNIMNNPFALQQLQLQQQLQMTQMAAMAARMPGALGMTSMFPMGMMNNFNFARPMARPLSHVVAANNQRAGMRVQIDKRNKSTYDAHFLAVETNDKAHADEVVKRCEEISKSLQSHLGNDQAKDNRFGATNEDSQYQQVTLERLKEACGPTARYLKPYQIVGVNFLMLLYRTRIGGAILADEMGLGKTAQLIVYLGAIRAIENDPGPHLVVVPASLLENWQRELRRWCPSLKTIVYYGKHRSIVRKRVTELRERLARGEEVNDDLADLHDPDLLAEAAASVRAAEAAVLDNQGDGKHDDDPFGYKEAEVAHESDDDFDVKRDNAKDNGKTLPPVEEPPIKWDPNMPLQKAPFNVMLTCYTLFERDSPEQREDRKFLESWRWSHLIMDEAHALKNRNAARTSRLRRVANTSRRRVMMTGTPLQNDLVELQNLLHFLLPQVFAAQAQGFKDFEAMLQGDENEIHKLTERMKSLLGPFVLRRMKTEVAGQLTEKKHTTEFINMTPLQQTIYDLSIQQMRSQIVNKAGQEVAAAGEGADPTAVEKFIKSVGAKKINHIFTHLRKVAQHPLLVRHHYDDKTVEAIAAKALQMQIFGGKVTFKKVCDELNNYSDYSLHAFCYNHGPEFFAYRLNSSHLMSSAKFQFLAQLLPKLKAEGSRPLIFSQWTAVLDVIEWLMDEMRLPYVRLDGSTAVDERLATVDKFNNSEDVFAFLLSTRAGGQGLNLTGADTVIIHDVDFNPQIDRQAEDRCHRLGQTRPVMVYRLITKGSVDQNIFNLSQNKLKLDRAVLEGITSGKGARRNGTVNSEEKQQMGTILHTLFAGKEDYDQMAVLPDEIEDELPEWKKNKERASPKKEIPVAHFDAPPVMDAPPPPPFEVPPVVGSSGPTHHHHQQQQQQQQAPVANGVGVATTITTLVDRPPSANAANAAGINKIRLKVKMPVAPSPAAAVAPVAVVAAPSVPPTTAPVALAPTAAAAPALANGGIKPTAAAAATVPAVPPPVVVPTLEQLPIAPLAMHQPPPALALPPKLSIPSLPIAPLDVPALNVRVPAPEEQPPVPAPTDGQVDMAVEQPQQQQQQAVSMDATVGDAAAAAASSAVMNEVPSLMSLDTTLPAAVAVEQPPAPPPQ